jgi:hypothetical protein
MKELKVKDGARTNELSLKPGGDVVRVQYTDGKKLIYDKVKNIRPYISRIIEDINVSKVFVNDELYWER